MYSIHMCVYTMYTCICIFVHVYGARVLPWHTCRGQRAIFRSQLHPLIPEGPRDWTQVVKLDSNCSSLLLVTSWELNQAVRSWISLFCFRGVWESSVLLTYCTALHSRLFIADSLLCSSLGIFGTGCCGFRLLADIHVGCVWCSAVRPACSTWAQQALLWPPAPSMLSSFILTSLVAV